ncbi:MAG: PKD domain-containing protein [Bacteroidota bacterium]
MNKFFKIILLFLVLVSSISIANSAWISSFKASFPLSGSSTNDPVADFTFTPNNECADQSVQFTNQSTGTGLTYLWDFGDGNTSTQENPTHTFSSAIGGGTRDFEVKLTVTDSDENDVSIEKTVTVKEIPSLMVSSDQDDTTFDGLQYYIICENEPSEFTFYNAATTNENNTLYEIDWGDGSAAFSGANWTSLSHTYSVGIYKITYSVTSQNGCKISREYGVFVGSNPAVGLGNPGNTNVCVGEMLTFPISGTENNPDGTVYTVTFSDGSTPQEFNHPPPATVSHTFTKTSCGTTSDGFDNSFSVKIVATNPCAVSQASVVPIYVSEPPIPLISIPQDVVCVNESIQIRNLTNFNVEVGNNGVCSETKRFVWEIEPATGWTLQSGSSLGSRPNPTSPNSWTSGSENLVPRFTQPGTYTVKLITGNRCGIQEETETICIIPTPDASFDLSATELCESGEIQVTNTSNILGACGNTSSLFNWSISYNQGNCGNGPDWNFINGTDASSENPEFEFLSPGSYTLQLAINSSCGVYRESQVITVSAPPLVEIQNLPAGCGSSKISPTADIRLCDQSTPSYLWTFEDGVPATSTEQVPGEIEFTSTGAKKITLEVTTACGITVSEKTFTIAEPPTIDAGPDTEICNGEEIQLSATATGGSGNYTVQWSANPPSAITDQSTFTPTVKPSITTVYTATVTDTDTGCQEVDEIQVTVTPAPTISFDQPNQEICSGESTLPVTITSNPAGETITWTAQANGVTGADANGSNTIPAQTLVNTGSTPIEVIYTAEISNASQGNCAVVPVQYIIKVNPIPDYQNEELEICSGESFNFQPNGFITGTTFTWDETSPNEIQGASESSTPSSAISQQLVNTSNQLQEVRYLITPKLGDCTGDPFELLVKVAPSPSINFSVPDQILCTGSTSQAVTLSSDVTGATFSWTASPQVTGLSSTSGTGPEIPAMTLENPTNAPIEIRFEVLVNTNTAGSCSGTPRVYTITVNPDITIQATIPDYNGFQISCHGANDGSIKLALSGGNGQYDIDWNGPNGFSSSSESIENLAPGTYTATIKDEFGCVETRTYTLNEPAPLTATLASKTDVLCAGDESGEIVLDIAGGVNAQPYTVSWKKDGVDFPKSGSILSLLPAGEYQATIRDVNGCTLTPPSITITEPDAALFIDFSKTDISCYGANDGSLDLNVSGGFPPYTIQWTFGSAQSSFDNLGPGDYTLTVSDQSGCIRSQTITIEDAPLFRVDPDVRQISCFGENDGSIKLNLQGGVGAYTIRWDDGRELEQLFNLSSGTYGVTIIDETACEIRSEFNIVEPALLEIEPQVTDALDCDNTSSGEIRLGIKGGTPPYSIKWSNGSTDEVLTGITSGQYAVEISDASSCTINQVFEVKRPPTLAITAFQNTNIQCEPRSISEEIKITISGGVAPYSISWSGGNISSDQRTMTTDQPGLYSVNVLDGNGCTSSQSFEVKDLEVIPEAEIESATFDQYNSYLVNFEIQFWNRSFGQIAAYHWDFGDGNQSFEENPIHKYAAEGDYEVTLTVTDIFGCSVSITKEVSVLDYYLVIPDAFTPNGDGINDYFFPRFINIESLEFWVLNKWGETIYYTEDLSAVGWDGKVNNTIGTPGNYVYKLRFKTLDGRTQTVTDLFLLLK